MSTFSIQVKGVEEARARELGNRFGEILTAAGAGGFDLRDLDGVVLAMDYRGELKALERADGPALTGHTDNEFGLGVAKAVAVERDGTRKTVVVVNAVLALDLLGDDEVRRNRVIGVALHELWHVHERRVRMEIWAKGPPATLNDAERYFMPLAEILWEEYSANRVSATLVPDYGKGMAESVRGALRRGQPAVDKAIKECRSNGDVEAVFQAVSQDYDFSLRSVAYLLGNLDGNTLRLDDVAPGLRDEIASSKMAEFWPAAEVELRRLHDGFPAEWPDQSVFRPVFAALSKLFLRIGIEFVPDGQRVRVRLLH